MTAAEIAQPKVRTRASCVIVARGLFRGGQSPELFCKHQLVEQIQALPHTEAVEANPCGQPPALAWSRVGKPHTEKKMKLFGVPELPCLPFGKQPAHMPGEGQLEVRKVSSRGMDIDTSRRRSLTAQMARTILLGQDPSLGQTLVAPLAATNGTLPLLRVAGMRGRTVDPAKLPGEMAVETGSVH